MHALRSIPLVALLALTSHAIAAEADDAPALRIDASFEAEIRAGSTGSIDVRLLEQDGVARPLVLTPTSEGRAIEIVRGRLLRSDAESESHGRRFRVPFVAREAGIAIVRIRADGYLCAERCRPIRAEATVRIRVVSS